MPRARGIYRKLIEGGKAANPTEVRSKAMRTITSAAKKLVAEVLGEEGVRKPGLAWFVAIKLVAPTFWEIVKETQSLPSEDVVVAKVKEKHPDYAEKIRSAYAITKPVVVKA